MRRKTLMAAIAFLCCAASLGGQAASQDQDAPDALPQTGDSGAHDPTIVEFEGRYYRFTTGRGLPISFSEDLMTWKSQGLIFLKSPAWTRTEVPGSTDFWAPEVVKMNGVYRVYYSVSTFGSNLSAIGLVSNPSLDPMSDNYEWKDEGMVFKSERSDPYNAIDPAVAFDESGTPWMAFGSFWSGIKLLKLDEKTGKPADPESAPLSLARRLDPVDAIEGAYIYPKNGWYYLFVSFDFCCKGVRSTYNIRVGRSKSIVGPYRDREGVPMLEGGGTLIREGGERYKGPGHNSILATKGIDYIVYHSYDAKYAGMTRLRIESLRWDGQGWPYVTGIGAGAR